MKFVIRHQDGQDLVQPLATAKQAIDYQIMYEQPQAIGYLVFTGTSVFELHCYWQPGTQNLNLTYDHHNYVIQRQTVSHNMNSNQTHNQQQIHAFMPGKIVTIPVQLGDEVAKGSTLIIIEAMKMENEIKAPVAAKITAIMVKPGQTVDKQALLLKMEPLNRSQGVNRAL